MKKQGWFAGVATIGACALCCALPWIGAAAVVSAPSLFWQPMAAGGAVLVFVAAGIVWFRRRKVAGATCSTAEEGCRCRSCAK